MYKLRYRKPLGVCLDLIEARDYLMAVQVGKTYCSLHPNYTYIGIEDAIIATDAILLGESPAETDPTVPGLSTEKAGETKPSLAEQHARQRERKIAALNPSPLPQPEPDARKSSAPAVKGDKGNRVGA